ncbi:MAG TPA: hypothetical protein VKK19_19350 [Candidatus Dormibacteraeota bacterium]|nr:hypothetical protein [Candidatus Dormibacteraeota bacterium]
MAATRKPPGSSTISNSLPVAKLYIDDLEAMVDTLRQLGHDVSLETGTHILDSPAELLTLGSQPQRQIMLLTRSDLMTEDPEIYVSVDLLPKEGRVWASTSGAAVQGVVSQIRNFVWSRRRRGAWLGSPEFNRQASVLAFVLILAGDIGAWSPRSAEVRLGFGAAFGLGLAIAVAVYCGRRLNRMLIIPRRRSEELSFWQRNRDAMGVGVIVGVIVAIVSGLIGFVLGSHR